MAAVTVAPPASVAAGMAATATTGDDGTSPVMSRTTDRYCPPSDDVVAHVRAQVADWPQLTPAQVSLLAHAFAPAVGPATRQGGTA